MHKSYIKNSLILDMIHDYDKKNKKQNKKEMLGKKQYFANILDCQCVIAKFRSTLS